MDADKLDKLKSAGLELFIDSCYGCAFFDNIGKLGFIVGVGGGEGQVFKKDRAGDFTQVGTSTMIEASGGWSVGVQVYSEVIFFQNEEAFNNFTTGTFTFDASAKYSIATIGGAASDQYTFFGGMAIFIIVKGGLMVDVSAGGQSFTFKPL